MNFTVPITMLAIVLGTPQNGHEAAAPERQVSEGWDADRMWIEWGESGLVYNLESDRERPLSRLKIPGQIFYDASAGDPTPNWSEHDLQILFARRAGDEPDWQRAVHWRDTTWQSASSTSWKEGEISLSAFFDDAHPTIDDEGRFFALLHPAAIRRVVGGTGMHQVAACFQRNISSGVYGEAPSGAFIQRSLATLSVHGPDPLSPVQSAINGAPSPCSLCFDPVALIRAVNRLHALGFDEAIRELRDYLSTGPLNDSSAMCGSDPRNPDTLDRNRFFLILRLLFVRKEGAPLFAPRFGEPTPFPAMRSGVMAAWPSSTPPDHRYPLLVVQDVPFFMPQWLVFRSGPDISPGPHLEWAAMHCELRENPLRPPNDPFAALDALAELQRSLDAEDNGSDHWIYEEADEHGRHLSYGNDPRRQVWHSLEDATGLAVPEFPYNTGSGSAIPKHLRVSEKEWSRLRAAAAKLDLYWDEQSQSYRGRAED